MWLKDSYNLTTSITAEEVVLRIQDNLVPWGFYRNPFLDINKPYQGEIANNNFTIRRIVNYRSGFLPILYGTIRSSGRDTVIDIVAKPRSAAVTFVAIWSSCLIIIYLIILAGIAVEMTEGIRVNFSPAIVLPLVMLFLGCGAPVLLFRYENNISKKFLLWLLDAQLLSA